MCIRDRPIPIPIGGVHAAVVPCQAVREIGTEGREVLWWADEPPSRAGAEERRQRRPLETPPVRSVRSRTPRSLDAAIRRVQSFVGGVGVVLVADKTSAAAPAAIAAEEGGVHAAGAERQALGDAHVADFPPEAEPKSLSALNDKLLKCSVSTDVDDVPWEDKWGSLCRPCCQAQVVVRRGHRVGA